MITVDDLSFSYRPTEMVIDHLDFAFEPGTISGVTGPSGRGKSTLLYLIGLLLTPTSGAIVIDGSNTHSWSDSKRSKFRSSRVGFVFQDASLDPTRTVLDNVVESSVYNKIPRTEAVKRAHQLMTRFGVALRHDHRPGEVSGGQAQRIALCRAMLSQPDILLADEPTGNLDSVSAEIVVDALRESAQHGGGTVIIATHDSAILAVCDRTLEL